ncbi:MAG: hypothetical protein IT434_01845 [Phycisphaerales bacterium]|jgi:hypothetical protein|nr:hypothetical protein [Phycisphaerales bacterium]
MQTRSAEPIDRCVIWTPRGRHAPEELVGVLEKRGFHIAHASSAHETVGELCALAREGMPEHGELAGHDEQSKQDEQGEHAGLDGNGAIAVRPRIIVLIVTDPTNLDHLSAAYSAASEYAPRLETRVVCWWFDEPSRRLRAADSTDIARWGAGLEVVVKPGAGKKLIERGAGANRATPSAIKAEGQSATGAGDAKASSSGSAPVPTSSPSVSQQADDVAEMFLGKGRPSLRLAGEGTLPPSQEESENPRPGDIPAPTGGMGGMLTGEELAMLLDPDPPGRAFRTE